MGQLGHRSRCRSRPNITTEQQRAALSEGRTIHPTDERETTVIGQVAHRQGKTGRHGAPWQARLGEVLVVRDGRLAATHPGRCSWRPPRSRLGRPPTPCRRPARRPHRVCPRRTTYRTLLLKGMAPEEAANLTAYLAGIPIGDSQLDAQADQPAALPPPDAADRSLRRRDRGSDALTIEAPASDN